MPSGLANKEKQRVRQLYAEGKATRDELLEAEAAIDMAMAHGQTQVINRFRVGYLMSFNAAGRLRQIIELLDAAGDDWRTRPVDTENIMSRAYYGLMLIWMGRLDEARQHLHAAMVESGRGSWGERVGR